MKPHGAADSRVKAVSLALLLGTLLIYAPVNYYEFVDYDDNLFILTNPIVLKGLSAEGMAWAFGTPGSDYWRPLSWLSHMVDVELFDTEAGAHHAMNLFLHAANALLLCHVLRRMTGALWLSAFVAALFAWHPLHVESVAWVAERKDVLCAFFWFLTMGAYARYAAAPSWRRYGLVVLCFVLGLMSKPMIVTLPCVLLLLDVWPLRRWELPDWRIWRAGPAPAVRSDCPPANLGRLVLEKLPLLALAAGVSLATYVAADKIGAVTPLTHLPLGVRISNASCAYVSYLSKLVWPADLIVFYPGVVMGKVQTAASIGILMVITVLAIHWARSRPYLLVGWLWFLGTLVPVIGLIQAGGQAFADRYTYLPLVGVFMAVAWGAADCAVRRPQRTPGLTVAAVLALAACLAVTGRQLTHWQDSYTLGRHALAVAPSATAACIAASGLRTQGRTEEGIRILKEALPLNPYYRDLHLELGYSLLAAGRHAEARKHSAVGLRLSKIPDQIAGIIRSYAWSMESNPRNPELHYNLAAILVAAGQFTNALTQFSEVLRLKPDYTDAWIDRGALRVQLGDLTLAAQDYAAALRLSPSNEIAQANLGGLLAGRGELAEAVAHYQAALRVNPTNSFTQHNLALALMRLGRAPEAVAAFRVALRHNPDLAIAHDRLAWLLATHPAAAMRDGKEAVRLAERANRLVTGDMAGFQDTLAAALAETGRFAEAVAAAQRAVTQARAAGRTQAAAEYQSRLERYQARQPYRTPPMQPAPP